MSSRIDAMQDSLQILARDSKRLMKCLIVFSYSVHSAPLLAKFTDLLVYLSLHKNPLFLQTQFKTTVCNMVLMV